MDSTSRQSGTSARHRRDHGTGAAPTGRRAAGVTPPVVAELLATLHLVPGRAVTHNPTTLTAVVSQFPAPSQTFILRKLTGLRDAGMDVTVAAAEFTAPESSTGFDHLALLPWRSPSVALESTSRPAWRAAVAALSTGSRSLGSLRRSIALAPITAADTDIVHFEFSGIAVSYLDQLSTLQERSRLVVSCRGAAEQIQPLKDPARRAALAEVFDAVDLVHCVSEDMRRTVEDLGAPADRILVNRPAVPVADFAALRARDTDHGGPFRLLSIGRLHWKKGLDDAVRAVALLRGRGVDVEYRIAGEGSEREKLSFMIQDLGLDGSVHLAGVRSQDQVCDMLGWADALLLPSLSEGISNAVLEAMAAGLAVVTTDCGGMTEVVHQGVNGLVVDVGDIGAMAEHLAALSSDPDLRARLGVAAAETADESLDISHQVRRFTRAYAQILAPED